MRCGLQSSWVSELVAVRLISGIHARLRYHPPHQPMSHSHCTVLNLTTNWRLKRRTNQRGQKLHANQPSFKELVLRAEPKIPAENNLPLLLTMW